MLTLSPTLRSRTWATRDRVPSMELPFTAVMASPARSPALSAGVPATTLVSTAAERLADPSAMTPSLEETPGVGVGGFAGGGELVGDHPALFARDREADPDVALLGGRAAGGAEGGDRGVESEQHRARRGARARGRCAGWGG